jgi:hypothetical protein
MRTQFSAEEIENSKSFELISEISYKQLKPFILNEVSEKTWVIRVYAIIQTTAITLYLGLLLFFVFRYFREGFHKHDLLALALSLPFSFTVLIPLHELLHAAAFLILGKRKIGFGAQWKKFLFYAEAHRQVLNGKEITFVALLPFLVISATGLVLFGSFHGQAIRFFMLGTTLLHTLFCAGDVAIISFFVRNLPNKFFTFDDRYLKKTFYFKQVKE